MSEEVPDGDGRRAGICIDARSRSTSSSLVTEWRGRVWQPDRDRFRRWLRDDLRRRGWRALAVEGCMGWRYVVDEIV
jgi:hypothetical protein